MTDVWSIDYDSAPAGSPIIDPLPWLAALAAEQGRPLGSIAGADLVGDLLNALSAVLGFPGKAVDWLWDRFLDVYNWLNDRATKLYWDLYATIDHFANGAIQAVGSVFTWLWDAAHWVGDRVADVIGFLWGLTTNVFNWLWDTARWVVSQVFSTVGNVFGWLWDTARWVVSQVFSTVGNVFGWLWDTANHVVSSIGAFFSQVWAGIWDAARWLWEQTVGRLDSVLDHLANLAVQVVEAAPRIIIEGAAAIGEGFLNGLEWFVDHVFDPIAKPIEKAFNLPALMLGGYDGTTEGLIEALIADVKPGSFGSLVLGGLFLPPALLALLSASGHVYGERSAQRVRQLIAPELPGFGDIREAYLRGFIPDAEVTDLLGRHGFNADRMAWLRELFFEVPALADTIEWADRGIVGSAGSAATLSQQELPADLLGFARRAGIDADQAQNAWAAHWTLPGLGEAQDMRFRGIVDDSALDDLLRARGILPFWRDKLKEAAFTQPNRRELRGLFTAGVISEDQLAQSYAALGFPPDLVTVYVDYAKRTAAGAPATLPRDIVLTAFRDRLLTRDQAAAELAALKFTPEDVDLFLALEDYKLEQVNVADAEAIVEADLKAGSISDGAAIEQLQALGLPQTRAVLLVNRWRRRAAVRTATLSASEVQRLLKEQLINDDAAIARFRVLGYNEADARFLVELAGPAPAAKPSPELTVSQLRQAVRAGILTEADANARLHRLGWSDPDIAILDRLTDPATTTKAPPELTLAELLKATKAGVIDTAQLTDSLTVRGYSSADIAIYLATEKLGPQPPSTADLVKAKTLNVAQLQKALKDGLITEDEFRARLAALGYAPDDVELLVELVSSKAPSAQSA